MLFFQIFLDNSGLHGYGKKTMIIQFRKGVGLLCSILVTALSLSLLPNCRSQNPDSVPKEYTDSDNKNDPDSKNDPDKKDDPDNKNDPDKKDDPDPVQNDTGIFAYTINYPVESDTAALIKAQMSISDEQENAAADSPYNILAVKNGNITLNAGSYIVTLNLEIQWGNSALRSIAYRQEAIMITQYNTCEKAFDFAYNDFVLLLTASSESGSAYPIIQSRGFDYESPDQNNGGHTEYGSHIVQYYDAGLDKNVFAFMLHRNDDRNATGDWTRQRVEIKIDHRSGSPGRDYCAIDADQSRSFIYRWKFKLPEDFAVSADFTHIHQIKNEGGDSSQPIIALTARAAGGNPNDTRMQLSYYAPGSGSPVYWVNTANSLPQYLGQWVQCEESITYSSDPVQAAYSLKITSIANSNIMMNYTAAANAIQTWRSGNTHGRPKFGLYRRIFSGSNPGNYIEPLASNAINGLKDETVLFADFEVIRLK